MTEIQKIYEAHVKAKVKKENEGKPYIEIVRNILRKDRAGNYAHPLAQATFIGFKEGFEAAKNNA